MAEASAKFLTGNLFRHVVVMSLTSSIGLVAVFLVDLVDMVFISMLGRDELAAAVGYAGAILFFSSLFSSALCLTTFPSPTVTSPAFTKNSNRPSLASFISLVVKAIAVPSS